MVVLRAATEGDVDGLVQLHLDTVGVAYRDFFPPEAPKPSPDVLRGLWLHDIRDAHAVVVAIEANVIVGSVVARRGGDLARLHVHPSRWRQGIGGRLHDAAVAALRSAGYRELGLWVIERNAPARALYHRAGWRLDPSKELLEMNVLEVRYTLTL